MRYLRTSRIKELIWKNGRRAGKDFLLALDVHVEAAVLRAVKLHNGGKKTLDAAVAAVAGIRA